MKTKEDLRNQGNMLYDLMLGMLHPDPKKRFTIDEVLEHEFFKVEYDILKQYYTGNNWNKNFRKRKTNFQDGKFKFKERFLRAYRIAIKKEKGELKNLQDNEQSSDEEEAERDFVTD